MKKIDTNPPSGTRDFLPEEAKFRDEVFATIKGVFERFGFVPLETPAFERLEILTGKYGEAGEKLIYKILKRGERAATGEADLALRYDLTVPLARAVAHYRGKLPRIFRRYQIGPVWRADRPGKERFREFYQCDIDTVGTDSLLADAEILLALDEVFVALGVPRCTIQLNSRKVLVGLLEEYGIPPKLQKGTLMSLDKLDKVGLTGVEEELQERGVPLTIVQGLVADMRTPDVAFTARKRLETSRTGQSGLAEVDEIQEFTVPLLKGSTVVFSPFLARGLDYYTGSIFEVYTDGVSGSIASGGRYDSLMGMFGKKSTPACGGSLGIERVFLLLQEKSKAQRIPATVKVLVTVWDKSLAQESLRLAAELREKGITTEVYLGKENVGKQIGFASSKKIPFCLLFGPNEREREEVSIKNLNTGSQISVPRNGFAERVRSELDEN